MNIVPISCSARIDEIKHDLNQPELSKDELYEAAIESFLSGKPHEYTNEAEHIFENFDVPLLLARFADTQDDDLELGRQIRSMIDNQLNAVCES